MGLREAISELESWMEKTSESHHRPVRIALRGHARGPERKTELCFPHAGQAAEALRMRLTCGTPSETKTPEEESPALSRSLSIAKEAFRYEVRENIPDELLEGPFEDFEIPCDVYTTAYLVARNATPDMYSIWPWRNPQVRPVWRYLFFIIGSQLFIISMLTCIYPPCTNTETWHVDCSNTTSLAMLATRGVIDRPLPEDCTDVGDFAFEADVRGITVSYYKLERSTPFYENILAEGSTTIYLLRLICCIWQFSQMYLQHFANIKQLFEYHDFSRWFLRVKGEEVRNGWVICIPIVQYCILLVVTIVSFAVLCAQTEAFDIVMNSLAFTFIAEVGGYFNEPLAKYLSTTKIRPAPWGNEEIYYLYAEYAESNAVCDDGTYTDAGWYICEDETGKAGLLSDYKIRHNPAKYPHRSELLVRVLEWVLFVVPIACVVAGGVYSRTSTGLAGGGAGVSQAEL